MPSFPISNGASHPARLPFPFPSASPVAMPRCRSQGPRYERNLTAAQPQRAPRLNRHGHLHLSGRIWRFSTAATALPAEGTQVEIARLISPRVGKQCRPVEMETVIAKSYLCLLYLLLSDMQPHEVLPDMIPMSQNPTRRISSLVA